MRILLLLTLLTCSINGAEKISGDYYKKIIFEEDFSKNLGKSWSAFKSGSKVQDGILVALMPPGENHNSVNAAAIPAHSDVEASVKFKFEGSPYFIFTFNDKKYKGSHAGHICRVQVSMNSIVMRDGKTGLFKREIWDKKKKGKNRDKATKDLLKTKSKKVSCKLSKGKWYTLQIRIKNDLMQVFIDDKFYGEFRSEGIAHSSKNYSGLVVNKQAVHFDDFKIKVP